MPSVLLRHRAANLLRSGVLLGALAAVLGAVGWLLGGWSGLAATAVVAIVLALITPLPHAERALRMQGARRLSAPWLERAVADLARRAGLPEAPALWVVPIAAPQAMASAGHGRPALAVSPSLLAQLSPREVIAVLAHEISHLSHRDLGWMRIAEIVRALTRASAQVGLLLVLVNLPMMLLAGVHVPWLALLVLVGAGWAVNLLVLALSRAREHDADAGAVALTGDPLALASALRRIEALARPWWHALLHVELPERWRTHPDTERRVERLLEMARGPRPAPRTERAERPRVIIPEWRGARR
ncbi:MAG: M48 family metalloprotease [Sandaracinaceae bacterium]|nr:M48 family metalloprotease [Sandaracinaceae bacterium]